MMNPRMARAISFGLIVLALIYSAVLYPHLPDPLPIHWNIRGEVDGWWPRWQGVLLIPALMLVILVLLQTLPKLPISKSSVEAFRATYDYISVIVIALIGYVHGTVLWAAVHPKMDLPRVLLAGVLLFLAAIGNVMGKLRPNRWAGVRTPWTLASEAVWVGTHRFAARIYVVGGVAGAAAVLLGAPWWAAMEIVIPLLLLPIPYSYLLYRRRGD